MIWLLLLLATYDLPEMGACDLSHRVKVVVAAQVMAWRGGLAAPEEALAVIYHESKARPGWAIGAAGECGPCQVLKHKRGQVYFGNPCFGGLWIWNAWVAGNKTRHFRQPSSCGRYWLNCYNGAPVRTGAYKARVERVKARIEKAQRRVMVAFQGRSK